MAISGRLEDLSAVDALQFFHMSARSGQLTFESSGQRAWLALRDGRITGASLPGRAPPIGKVLCELTGVPQAQIDDVVSGQTGKPLGWALVESGLITKEQLRVALTRLIRMVVAEVIQWGHGSFAFEPGVVERSDDIGYVPEELLPDIALDVQEVLLEALRRVDEAARPGQSATIPSPAPAGSESPWLSNTEVVHELSPDARKGPGMTPAASISAPGLEPPRRATDLGTPLVAPSVAAGEGAQVATHTSSLPVREKAEAPKLEQQGKGGARKVVVVLTGDGFFRYGLTAAWSDAEFGLKVCGLEQEAGHHAAEAVAGGADVVLIVHASGADAWSGVEATPRCLRRIKALAPSVPILLIGKFESSIQREAFRLGVRHVLETPLFDRNMRSYLPQFQKFEAALRDAVSGTFEDLAGSDTFVGGATSDIKKLALKIEGLRRSTEKRAVAMGLLEYVAENVERAVMFLVGPGGGTVIGAFGANEDVPLSQLVVGMKVSYESAPVLRLVVETGRAFRGSANPEIIGCAQLIQRIGSPKTGHAVFLPVRGASRVFAALYLDNGSRALPLVSTEALQILSAHAGLMLENLALQRARQSDPKSKVLRVDAVGRALPPACLDPLLSSSKAATVVQASGVESIANGGRLGR